MKKLLAPIVFAAGLASTNCVIEERGPNQPTPSNDVIDDGHNHNQNHDHDHHHSPGTTGNNPNVNPPSNADRLSEREVMQLTGEIQSRFQNLIETGQVDQNGSYRGVFEDSIPESDFQLTPVIFTTSVMGQFGRNQLDRISVGISSRYSRTGNRFQFSDVAAIEADELLRSYAFYYQGPNNPNGISVTFNGSNCLTSVQANGADLFSGTTNCTSTVNWLRRTLVE
jgi:hypothetical protein